MTYLMRKFGVNAREVILNALNTYGDIKTAAEHLNLCRKTLTKWIRILEIERKLVWAGEDNKLRTKKMIAFEERYGVDIVEFIVHYLNKSDNVTFVRNLLEVNQETFYNWRQIFKIKRGVIWE